jgi:hypothetical protein
MMAPGELGESAWSLIEVEEVSREMPNKSGFAPDLELAENGRPVSQQFMLLTRGCRNSWNTRENPTKTHYFEQYTTSERTIKKS